MAMFDGADEWIDDSKCIICDTPMGKSQELICSSTCDDLFNYKSTGQGWIMDSEEDCYA